MHRMSGCRNQDISVAEDQRVALLGKSVGSGLSIAEFRQRRKVNYSQMAASHGRKSTYRDTKEVCRQSTDAAKLVPLARWGFG